MRRDGAAVPQTLLVRFADGTLADAALARHGRRTLGALRLVTKSQAVSVELDPERRVFLDRDKLDDSRTLRSRRLAPRAAGPPDFAALLQSVLALLVTL